MTNLSHDAAITAHMPYVLDTHLGHLTVRYPPVADDGGLLAHLRTFGTYHVVIGALRPEAEDAVTRAVSRRTEVSTIKWIIGRPTTQLCGVLP
jgi:hypothetical protein